MQSLVQDFKVACDALEDSGTKELLRADADKISGHVEGVLLCGYASESIRSEGIRAILECASDARDRVSKLSCPGIMDVISVLESINDAVLMEADYKRQRFAEVLGKLRNIVVSYESLKDGVEDPELINAIDTMVAQLDSALLDTNTAIKSAATDAEALTKLNELYTTFSKVTLPENVAALMSSKPEFSGVLKSALADIQASLTALGQEPVSNKDVKSVDEPVATDRLKGALKAAKELCISIARKYSDNERIDELNKEMFGYIQKLENGDDNAVDFILRLADAIQKNAADEDKSFINSKMIELNRVSKKFIKQQGPANSTPTAKG